MNPILEEKLKDLILEAERQAAPAMYAVLDLLYGAYLNGKQHELAQHCCQLSPIQAEGLTVNPTGKSKSAQADDFWTDPVLSGYLN